MKLLYTNSNKSKVSLDKGDDNVFYFYKNGEMVPEWLESSNEVNMTFINDVMVHKLENVAHVFPLTNTVGLMFAEPKEDQPMPIPNVNIKGYPTVLHNEFEEFFTDYVFENYTFQDMQMRKKSDEN
jgi:hypothetical protein